MGAVEGGFLSFLERLFKTLGPRSLKFDKTFSRHTRSPRRTHLATSQILLIGICIANVEKQRFYLIFFEIPAGPGPSRARDRPGPEPGPAGPGPSPARAEYRTTHVQKMWVFVQLANPFSKCVIVF